MSIYDLKCKHCDTYEIDVILPITHTQDDLPKHCGEAMGYYITSPPSVHWVDPIIEPFRSVATKDKPIITSNRQRKEYMLRNGLLDANEVCEPPTPAETKRQVAQMQESINDITPSGEIKEDLDKRGLTNIV
jgi:hypothetical protein